MGAKRAETRRRVLKTGFIILSDKGAKLECVVRSSSASGATLQVSATVDIPRNFDLLIEGVRRHCRMIWRNDTQIGIAF